MTTLQDTPTIDKLLRDKLGKGHKSVAAREIGVSRQIYSQWYGGYAIPGPDWVEALSEYLDTPEEEIVLILYRSWVAKIRVLASSLPMGLLTHTVFADAA